MFHCQFLLNIFLQIFQKNNGKNRDDQDLRRPRSPGDVGEVLLS